MPRMIIEKDGQLPNNICAPIAPMDYISKDIDWAWGRIRELVSQGYLMEEPMTITDLGSGKYNLRVVMNTEKGRMPIMPKGV